MAPPAEPREDEVLIEVRAAGVGNWDDIMRTGSWPSGLAVPHALGVQAAGVVVAAGAAVAEPSVGAEVLTHAFPFRGNGAWAEMFLAPSSAVAAKPASMSWAVAGAIPVPALTAAQALAPLTINRRTRVFVHGAGGVTGGLIVQLAVAMGARVAATVGAAGASRVAAFGAVPIDRSRADWANQARAALGGTPEAAVSATPGGAAEVLALVADERRLVSIAGPAPDGVRDIVVRQDGGRLSEFVRRFTTGQLAEPTVRTFALEDGAAALDFVRRGGHGEAVVVVL